MYTNVVRKKQTPSEELGRFMREWRDGERLTVEQAAEEIGVSKSTWSNLERATRAASMETLIALSERTGRSVDSLAAMTGQEVRPSRTDEERARRAVVLSQKVPKARLLLDLLPELTDREIDTLLSVGENLLRQRED